MEVSEVVRVHQVVHCGEGFYLNRSSTRNCPQMPWAVLKLVQKCGESEEAFEERTVRAARRQGIPHVINLDGTN